MLRVYMDESGTHSTSQVVNVGAWIGSPVRWAIFSKRWNKTKGSVKAYHATDLHNLSGEFKGWDKDKRNEFVIKMLSILKREAFFGVVAGIHMDEFNKHLDVRPDLKDLLPSPYGACVQWVVGRCCKIAAAVDENEIAFVHEKNDFQNQAEEAFEFIQEHYKTIGMNMTMEFGDKTLAPLQAADIIAFEGNRMLRDPAAPVRKPWLAIDPNEDKCEVVHYGKDNMPALVSTLEEIKGMTYEELHEKAKANALSPYSFDKF